MTRSINAYSKAEIQSAAHQLYERLAQTQTEIQQLSAVEQFQHIQYLSPCTQQLRALEGRVKATYMRSHGAIPDVNNDELMAIALKLADSSKILEAFDEIIDKISSVFIETSQSQSNTPVSEHYSPAGSQFSSAYSTTRTSSVSASQRAALEDDRRVKAEQDESYQASLYVDQYKDITGIFSESFQKTDHFNTFHIVINFYSAVKSFHTAHTSYCLPENREKVKAVLEHAENSMQAIIEAQRQEESEVEKTEEPQSVITPISYLIGLKMVLAQLQNSIETRAPNTEELAKNVTFRYNQLDEQNKVNLYEAVRNILAQKNRIINLRLNEVLNWGATPKKLIQGINRILPSSSILVESTSESMMRLFEAAVQTTTASSPENSLQELEDQMSALTFVPQNPVPPRSNETPSGPWNVYNIPQAPQRQSSTRQAPLVTEPSTSLSFEKVWEVGADHLKALETAGPAVRRSFYRSTILLSLESLQKATTYRAFKDISEILGFIQYMEQLMDKRDLFKSPRGTSGIINALAPMMNSFDSNGMASESEKIYEALIKIWHLD